MPEGFRALNLVRPFLSFIPQVPSPDREVLLREKVIYTVISLVIFLIGSQLPLYGIHSLNHKHSFYWMRVLFASNPGTLMELGIIPIFTSALYMQILASSKLILADDRIQEDRVLLNASQKLLGVFIAVGMAVANVQFGMYGNLNQLGVGNAILIIFQLSFAGIIVIYLEDLLQKGYGVGSGISLFIATNICESIIWKSFSPRIIKGENGSESEGAVIALFHLLITKNDMIGVFQEAFYRQSFPNMTNLLATVLVFLIAIYFQGFYIVLPVASRSSRQQRDSYTIRLFMSNIPIFLLSALVSSLSFISQILYKKYSWNFVVNLLGKWQKSESSVGQFIPTGGIAYYITAPSSMADMVANPSHALFYLVFMLSASALVSKDWIEVFGSSAEVVSEQLEEPHIRMLGNHRSNLRKELNQYVYKVAALGGICVGALIVLADFTGVVVSGVEIVLAATIMSQYSQTFAKERSIERGFVDL